MWIGKEKVKLSLITYDMVLYVKNSKESTMRYHFTQVRMAVIQKSTSNKCWRVWRKGNPLTLLVGMKTSTATMEIPKKNWK